MQSLSQAMTRFTVPGTSRAPDIPVRQAGRLYFRAENERAGRDECASVCSSVGHLPLFSTPAKRTPRNPLKWGCGSSFWPVTHKKNLTLMLGLPAMWQLTLCLSAAALFQRWWQKCWSCSFFITSLSLLPIIRLMPGWNFYHNSCLAIVVPQMQVIIFSSYG